MSAFFQLLIQVIQKEVTEDGKNGAALRSSLSGFLQSTVHFNTSSKEATNELQQTIVSYFTSDTFHLNIMIDGIEKLFQININLLFIALLVKNLGLTSSLLNGAARSITITEIREIYVKYGAKDLSN